MHDIRLIRENPEGFDTALARRGVEAASHFVLEHDRKRRELQTKADSLRSEKKRLSAMYGQLASLGQGNTPDALALKDQSVRTAQALLQVELLQSETSDIDEFLKKLPNLPADGVPEGKDETGNLEVSRWGNPRTFDFIPQEHADLGPPLGLDFETGALIAGARFTFLRGQMARLHRALAQFMLDKQTGENGYMECNPPLLVKDHAVEGTGQLPKFADDLFSAADMAGRTQLLDRALPTDFEDRMAKVQPGEYRIELDRMLEKAPTREQYWLIPTAEVSLTNAVRDQILVDSTLPLRMTALTPCFRSEAGAAGRDTRGFIRQHQFEKVELVSITRPEDSDAEHERMTTAAESILQALGLPYRKMLLCSGDMGFTARKTYDLEVWLPGQNAFREISSCSNCGDFQARRMNARYRPEGAKGTEFVHTLNGSGLAVGRTLVAVLENYQQGDGTVDVPEVLKPYMGGVTRLTPLG